MRYSARVSALVLCVHVAQGFVSPGAKSRVRFGPCRMDHSDGSSHHDASDARPDALTRSSLLKDAGEAAVVAAAGGVGEICDGERGDLALLMSVLGRNGRVGWGRSGCS